MKLFISIVIFLVVLFPVNASAGLWGPSNFWECVLEEMPGVKNDETARSVLRKCRKDFPGTYNVKRKKPVFGVKTNNECMIKYGKDVTSPVGIKAITGACYRLYPRK